MARLLAPVAPALRRASALAALQNLLWLAQAWAVAAAIGGVLAPPAVLSPLAGALIFLAVAGLRAGLGYLSEGLLFRAGDTVVAGLRARLLEREIADGPGAGTGGSGAIGALAAEKLDLLLPYVSRYQPAQARVMLVPLAILAVAFWYSWVVGAIFLITGPLIPMFQALIGMAAQQASEEQMDEIASLNDLMVDRLAALADFRLLGASGRLLRDFAARAEALRVRTMAVLRIAFLTSTVLELFAAIGVAMVAVFLGFSLLGAIGFGDWGTPFTPFAVIFLLILTPEFYQPLRDLSAAWHDRAAALAVARDLARWEEAPRSPGFGSPQDPAPTPLAGTFSLATRGVTLRRGARQISVPDFDLGPGQSLALTGPSGAGKTSALLAIAGLIRPETGVIEVCGAPLDESTADGWRARLGWMPQNPHFLDASLRENVAFDSGAPIDTALARANVAHVVAALPEGSDTRLGETGAGLSGGEARRITLARAIQAGPDLLLADEPTADLDRETARIVTDALMALAKDGMALIIATHDPDLIARIGAEAKIGASA